MNKDMLAIPDAIKNVATEFAPLIDRFGRVHNNLRISVTDRCNIRCFYCMPNENVQFRNQTELLTNHEIVRFVRAVSRTGIDRLRITGGEPLVRNDLPQLIEQLAKIDQIDDIGLTTNGMMLQPIAHELKNAGLQRINISLDTLTEVVFEKIARRRGIAKVLAGIDAAIDAGFEKIRLNAIAIRNLTETEIVPLARFAREKRLELRFIEFMPLDAENQWDSNRVLTGDSIRAVLESEFGALESVERTDRSQPAIDFQYADIRLRVGFINPVSQPFCHDCNRLRITADGQLRNCLFSQKEWDVRGLLRTELNAKNGIDAESTLDQRIIEMVRESISEKKAGHGIDQSDFVKPHRAMYQIGG